MRVKDLWLAAVDGEKVKTRRHPDRGGNRQAKRYLAIWIDPAGHERSKAFAKKGEAAKYAGDQESDMRRGEYIGRDAGQALISTLAKKWMRLREVSAGSLQRYESCYWLHIDPAFGSRRAGGVKPTEVAEWSRKLAGQPTTRLMALMILSGIFDLAVADGVRRDNPARSPVVIRPGQQQPAKREPWPAERIHAVATGCGLHASLPLVAAGLGLRAGEVFGLGLDDLDEDAGEVQVCRQVARLGGRYVFKLPKGGKTRTVPLPHGVAALAKGVEPTPVSLPWLGEDGKISKPVTVPLLFAWHGGHIQLWEWDRLTWKPALAAAGVIPAYEGRNYPPAREHGMHALRHWYSTTLLDSGVSLAGVMEYLGHSRKSAPLAVGVYGHRTPESDEAARKAIDRTLFRLRPVESSGTVAELRVAR
ncbi:MAG: tyrosine-type recombinase/integrase [Streptosporangiaceae bacterium]